MQKKTSARRASICFLAFINERTVCEADSGVRSTGSRVNVTWGTASRSRQQSAKHGFSSQYFWKLPHGKDSRNIMAATTEELLQMILQSLEKVEYIKSEDIPNIDLYMDQVLTFMDRKLRSAVRPQTEDRILTKTMINTYAKNDLLPPPVKKKYSKEHVLLLIFIYYYKGIIPMNEIQTLLKPLTDRYFQNGQVFDLESVYKEVVVLEKEQLEDLKKDVVEKFRRAEDSFTEVTGEEQEFLQKFALICLLSFDVYMKKMIVEQLVADLADTMKAQEPEKESHKKKN